MSGYMMPQAQYDFIKGIQDYMLKASNMDEHEAWDFGFRIWQFETWLYKYMTEDRGRNAEQTERSVCDLCVTKNRGIPCGTEPRVCSEAVKLAKQTEPKGEE